MTEYRTEQRRVKARILTHRGWLRGTFHPPHAAHLTDYLNHAGHFLNITDVLAEGGAHTLEHMALQKRAIILVAPLADPIPLVSSKVLERLVERSVYCLLREGSVTGQLKVTEHIRISDYFMNREDFILLREVAARMAAPNTEPISADLGLVVLNTWNVVGVAEI